MMRSWSILVKVIMIGNSPKVKGGITTVINQFKSYDWKKHNIEIDYISSYIDTNKICMFFYYIVCIIKLLIKMFSKPDYVHVHMSYKGSFYRAKIIQMIVKTFNVKFIAHIHGSEFEKWYMECKSEKKKDIRGFLRKCDCVIVLGKEWKEKLIKIEKNINICVVNNTVSQKNINADWNEKMNFVFLGVLIKRKGVEDLIRATKLMVEEKNTNFEVSIAGTGVEEKKLMKQVHDNSLEKYVVFRGWLNDKEKESLLENAQVMVLPSYNEGLPMSILEGMSYGLPIISTNVGDIPSVVSKENGFLYEPGNVEELRKFMETFCKMSEIHWKQMSQSSKDTIETNFSFETYVNEILNLYVK